MTRPWNRPWRERGRASVRGESGATVTADTLSEPRRSLRQELLARLKAVARALGDMLYGATVYEMVRDLRKERGQLEHLFILVVFGDLLGVPILPPYYTLRLLPYVVPNIAGWRYSMSREKDLTDMCDQDFT